jgi:glycosyltransferase involved in cell wall biosynthesis
MYPLCRRLVLLSEGLREYFSLRLQARVRIIPNPVTSFQGITKDAPLVGRKRLLAMGRLDYAKGFDLLLDAFVTLVSDFPQWDLRIQGEGPERANLEAKIAQLGLEGRVELPGYTPDPGSVFRGANLLVVSSRVEGFPNVLVEGMSCGLPVLATTCTSAIQEILEGGASGVLVEPDSAVALAEGLRAVMGDENRLMSLGLAARQVTARYAPERVLDMWENLLQKALE